MADIEKVIKGLECCTTDNCDECPYERANSSLCPWPCNVSKMKEDALSMLKEQKNEKKRNPVIICPHCGKRVK